MAYDNLLAAFEDSSIEADCGFVEKVCPLSGCFRPRNHDRIEFACTIHCKDWKWKSTTSSRLQKKVSILIHAREAIRKRDRTLLSSVVQVNYLAVEDGQSQLLQSVHFDYDLCHRDHPVFHAQITDDCIAIADTEVEPLKIDFAFPNPTCSRLRSARIPTCDMTFGSVLLCLAADHIGGKIFSEFRSRAMELQQKMPLPLMPKLRRSLVTEFTNVRSSHWFAHLFRVP